MLTSLIIAAVALPLFASATMPSNCARTYKVVEGDTCDAISAAMNSSTYQLATINNPTINDACSNLAIDQVICLGTTGEDCQTTYVVRPDDTCNGITRSFGFNATILYTNNPQINTDCSNIYVGEVLCASSSVLVPPAPDGKPATPVPVAPGNAPAVPAIPECEDPADDGEW